MTHVAESGRFYYLDGRPAYTLTGKNGKERKTNIKDARKLGLYPSVTTIIREAHSHGLENYKINQAVMAALTLPHTIGETEADWIARVRQDAKEHARIRAEEGTAIHAMIQGGFEGQGQDNEYYLAAQREIETVIGAQEWVCEKSFAEEAIYYADRHNIYSHGYGGKVDLHNGNYVLDIKTKEGSLDKVELYDKHCEQLAAYQVGLGLNIRCGILFVSTTEKTAKLVMVEEEDIRRGWQMFKALLEYYYAKNKLTTN